MNKIYSVFLALILSACAPLTLPSLSTVDISTTSSRNTLYGITNSYDIAVTAETAYKNICIEGSGDKNCATNIEKMKAADKKAISAIVSANNFIKKYPTISATNVISAAQQAVDDFKTVTGAQ